MNTHLTQAKTPEGVKLEYTDREFSELRESTVYPSHTIWLGPVVLGAVFLFLGVLAATHPGLNAFQLNKDEGYNWMKARLLADGHLLYDEIWSDQPPAFTLMLAGWCQVVGWEIENARLFMVFWSGILIFAVGDILRRECGVTSALLGVLAMICSQGFVLLSVAVMIGLPAIASALFAIWAISKWSDSHRICWVVLAGGLLGISLTIKLFTGFLIPIVITWLVVNGRGEDRNRFTPLFACLCSFATVVIAIFFFINADVTVLQTQLLGTHIEAHGEIQRRGKDIVRVFLRKDMALFVLAALGAAGVGRQFAWKSVPALFVAWFVIGTLILVFHRPVWSHHAMLMTVPASVLCGVAWKNAGKNKSHLVSVIFLASLIGGTAVWQSRLAVDTNDTDQRAVLKEMARYREVSRIAVVDLPIFCAHLGLRTPSELAVTSRKRFSTGRLDVATIVRVIQNERPEQVLLTGAFPKDVRGELSDILRSNDFDDYVLIVDRAERDLELFIRSDVLDGRTGTSFDNSLEGEKIH